ncbi:MAG: hypothetical protein LBC59_08125, partial [Chitinispirillales bacterium]|nr:hypothetical protein [Chitinispirillales bacterium]
MALITLALPVTILLILPLILSAARTRLWDVSRNAVAPAACTAHAADLLDKMRELGRRRRPPPPPRAGGARARAHPPAHPAPR